MSQHPRTVRNNKSRNLRPEVESLEDRTVPASVSVIGIKITIIGDDSLKDKVKITDNGHGRVKASISNSAGSSSATGVGIKKIVVKTKGKDDQVNYTCTGSLLVPLTMTVDTGNGNDLLVATFNGVASGVTANLVFLGGQGKDDFDVSLNGTIDGTLTATIDGGSEADSLKMRQSGAVAAGGTFNGTINGAADNDTILFRVTSQINGRLNVIADGGDGNDTLRLEEFLAAGSNTFIPLQPPESDMLLRGAGGDDTLQVSFDPTSTNHNFLITADGGAGTDTGQGNQPDFKTGIENDQFTI